MFLINRGSSYMLSSPLKFYHIKYLKSIRCQCNFSNTGEGFVPFETMVNMRRQQAQRSIIVEVSPQKFNVDSLDHFCSTYGQLKDIFTYTPPSTHKMVLIEFLEASSVKNLIRDSCPMNQNGITIKMPFLKLANKKLLSSSSSSSLTVFNEIYHSSEEELENYMLRHCKNISEQVQYLYDHTKMTEIGWRIRFMTCRKVEWLLPGLISHHKVLPYGSSVNTFGKHNCDLDMVIEFDTEDSSSLSDSPFCIQSLNSPKQHDRNSVQKNLELFADIIKRFMPGFSEVFRILHARVPIVKCKENYTGLECDISIGNKSGYSMSQLLYNIGCYDARVRPLVFSVRYWADGRRITDKRSPGRYISNFSLSLMVIFYLMNTKIPVLPTLRDFTTKDGSLPFNAESENSDRENVQNLEELLYGFFQFYAEFDYKKNAISIIKGEIILKPDYSALYIQNPIDINLNVSKNVNLEEVERIKFECLDALSLFDDIKNESTDDHWGLPALSSSGSLDKKKKKSGVISIKSVLEDPVNSTSSIEDGSSQPVSAKNELNYFKKSFDKNDIRSIFSDISFNNSSQNRRKPQANQSAKRKKRSKQN